MAADLQEEAQEEPPLSDEVLESDEADQAPKQRRRGRHPLPEHLERQKKVLEPEHLAPCAHCGRPKVCIGEELSEELEYVPAQLIVRQTVRPKYACRCGCGGVAVAPLPPRLLPQSKLGVGLAVHLPLSRFDDHVAYYTLERIFRERHDVVIPRQQMVQWVEHIAFLLQPLYRLMFEEMKKNHYLQIDETPVKVLDSEVKGKCARGYLWFYTIPGGDVFLDFQDTRGRKAPHAQLTGFSGTIQTDAYEVYDSLKKVIPNLVRIGCTAHSQRKFRAALKGGERRAIPFIALFRQLYRIEREAKPLTPENRHLLRQQKALPIWEALRQRAQALQPTLLPQSHLGKAVRYLLNEYEALMGYLQSGDYLIDNNLVEGSITLLAAMLAGRAVGIFETCNAVLGAGDRIFLPAEFSIANSRDANASLYELKTILAALALREGWHRNGVPLADLVGRCREEFPKLDARLAGLRASLPPDADLWRALGELPAPDPFSAEAASIIPPPESEISHTPITTEIQGQGQADVTVVPGQDDDGDGADLPTHTFEKVETQEEYTGMSRKSDDEDDLGEHAEALATLKMTQVMRSPERPRSIYCSDLILDGLSLEVNDDAPGRGIPYPEWDCKRREYRRDWCFVQEGEVTENKPDWASRTASKNRALIQRLKRQFHALTSDWLCLRRQPTGSEFDLDAVIDSEVERRTGHTPTESVYLDRRRDLHDIAALVLLDVSYSTDAWLNNRRVLDVITETVFCVGEVLADCVEQFALAAFTSNTRRACRFDLVKRFREPWLNTRARLGSLEPRGYTRIGPALRHAHELLLNTRASRKIVLLVTDGRPCDYDRSEGVYGIKDVKKAIEVGQRHGIQTHAFAVEKQAAEAFPQMFTRHHYDILPRPDALATTMCRLFARLLTE